MTMNVPTAATASSRQSGRAQPAAVPGQPRSVLIGVDTFYRLRMLQQNVMPSPPRLDMRYLLDGAVWLIENHEDDKLRVEWHRFALDQMLKHAQQQTLPGRQDAPGVIREQGGHEAPKSRHDDCKSLQIGESTFQALQVKQGTTEPRLGIRYLAEGAIEALLRRRSELLLPWHRASCGALRVHLDALTTTP